MLQSLKSKKNLTYIIIVIIILFLGLNNGFWALINNFNELQSLQKNHLALQAENKELKLKLKLIKNNEYMESMARKDGYIKPNELEYRFSPPEKEIK